jgi:transcription initiation factor TFIIH subunit 4
MKTLLEMAELIIKQNDKTKLNKITSKGFQFLLQGTKTQIWKLLKEYILTADSRSLKILDVLHFLFELSFLTPGKDYSVNSLTNTQKTMLHDLEGFGLIFRWSKDSPTFYPTQLSTGIVLNNQEANDSLGFINKNEGYLIIETNFKIYAYTSSYLHIYLLSLFVELERRTPDFVTGTISRKRIRESLESGITADQILSYMFIHAHPQMKINVNKKESVIPDTVSDQIRLWEEERNRIKKNDVALFDNFPNFEFFKICENFSKNNNIFIWSSQTTQKLAVKIESKEILRNFIQNNIKI